MKRVFFILGLFLTVFFTSVTPVFSGEISNILTGKKPYAILIYTDWADYSTTETHLKKLKTKHKNVVFKNVNLADSEAKELLDSGRIVIYKLPIVLIGKNNGKITQAIDVSCSKDYACLSKRIEKFAR